MTPIASYPPTPRLALRQAPSQSAAPNAAGHPQTMETAMSPQPSSLKGSTTPRRSGILTRAFKACAQVAGRLVGRIAQRITGCISRLARKAARPLALALALTAAATMTPAQAERVFPQLGKAACNSNVKYDVNSSAATVTGLGNRSNYKVVWDSFDLYPRANNSLLFAVDSQNKQPEVSFLNIVKGGQRSLIKGDIKAVSSAGRDINFYLINPNGITLYSDIVGFKAGLSGHRAGQLGAAEAG